MEHAEFYDRVKIGDNIPTLTKKTTLEKFEIPEIFGGIELATEPEKAQEKAEELEVDSIHTTKIFCGVAMLQFISEMITN